MWVCPPSVGMLISRLKILLLTNLDKMKLHKKAHLKIQYRKYIIKKEDWETRHTKKKHLLRKLVIAVMGRTVAHINYNVLKVNRLASSV